MSECQEPSLIEYARHFGLCVNHLERNPLGVLPPPEETILQLEDDESIWQQFRERAASPKPERLTAVKEASTLLAATNAKEYQNCHFDIQDPDLSQIHHVRDLKHELPLLRSDHDVDMLNFMRRIGPNLEDEFFPLEKVDDEQDEGFGWPSSYCDLPDLVFEKVQNERLGMGKKVLAYLKSMLDIHVDDLGEMAFENVLPMYKRQNRLRDHVSPPLLPRSPSPQPYEPSSETGHLDLLSERSSPTRQELDRVNERLLETDLANPLRRCTEPGDGDSQTKVSDFDSIGDLYSPLKGIGNTPSPRLQKRTRREDLKIEVPLTPPIYGRPPPWDAKGVSFCEAIQELIPDLPPPVAEPEDLSPEDIDMLFAEQIAPIAARAERKIEQEQLQEADTTSRVPVPVMDFAKPTPPWVLPALGNTKDWITRALCNIKEEHLKQVPSWTVNRETERKLSWVPFPTSLGRVELQDTVEDDGSLTAYIEQPEPLDPDMLTWKPPGLRILDDIHESDEEELACGVFPSAKDLQSLVKKRNLELQEEGATEEIGTSDRLRATKVARNGAHSLEGFQSAYKDRQVAPNECDTKSTGFSAIDALDRFLGIRRGELQENQKSKKVPPSQPVATRIRKTPERDHHTEQNVAQKSQLIMPKPQLKISDVPRYFIASTSFLSNRKLAHQIKNLYPSAEYIERDFTLYTPQSTLAEGCSIPPKNADTLLDEADLILSPSTGLVLTSLTKIKQQSLPGQSMRSLVRERIERTAARYERMVILVSRSSLMSDNNYDSSLEPLDGSDCEALTSLTAFLNHIPDLCESELILVDGDISAVATWVVSLMIKHAWETAVQLLQEETQWEVFLRQAGMNAFAAQVILAEMKVAEDDDNDVWGLRKFIFMSYEERCQRFEGLLGGRGVLERTGKALDPRR
ncbi:MAG: hypothetical protein L6R41_003633 [Letrouitia leprolyta]|nr:MAG: hypothetical protein L6R41_003633 [Letrouitia leprolyta]